MNRTLLIATALSLAFAGSAFAKSPHAKRAATSGATASEITQNDCQMLTVDSARAACQRSAVRANGGIDSAAVGMSSDVGATGQLQGGNGRSGPSTEMPTKSNETSDPATYKDMPR